MGDKNNKDVKPLQVLFNLDDRTYIDDLVKYYENQFVMKVSRANIIRMAIKKLHKKVIKK